MQCLLKYLFEGYMCQLIKAISTLIYLYSLNKELFLFTKIGRTGVDPQGSRYVVKNVQYLKSL